MIRALHLADANTLRQLGRTLTGLIAVACVISIYWSVKVVMLRSEEHALRGKIVAHKEAIAEAGKAVVQAKVVSSKAPKTTENAVGKFQAFVEQTAVKNGCVVQEFATGSEGTPYFSLYNNAERPAGWLQADLRMSISGTTSGIMETIRAFPQSGMLFEIKALDLQRASTDSSGNATVSAQIEMFLLKRQEAA